MMFFNNRHPGDRSRLVHGLLLPTYMRQEMCPKQPHLEIVGGDSSRLLKALIQSFEVLLLKVRPATEEEHPQVLLLGQLSSLDALQTRECAAGFLAEYQRIDFSQFLE
jgi:hypothetical protein